MKTTSRFRWRFRIQSMIVVICMLKSNRPSCPTSPHVNAPTWQLQWRRRFNCSTTTRMTTRVLAIASQRHFTLFQTATFSADPVFATALSVLISPRLILNVGKTRTKLWVLKSIYTCDLTELFRPLLKSATWKRSTMTSTWSLPRQTTTSVSHRVITRGR